MQKPIYIEDFDCMNAVANSEAEFWEALCSGVSGVESQSTDLWVKHFKEYWSLHKSTPLSALIKDGLDSSDAKILLVTRMMNLLKRLRIKDLDSKALGIIFSSTKGSIEDHAWDDKGQIDCLDIVLKEFIKVSELKKIALTQSVSNACASSHASISLAKKWLDNGLCNKVLIVSADMVGGFIQTGFKSLKALSQESCRPFQKQRDGLILGEAAAVFVLGHSKSHIELVDAKVFNESHAATSPSPEGDGLFKCIKSVTQDCTPDMAIAHATATYTNDAIEDTVLRKAQEHVNKDFTITATKWAVGHTLGTSGLVDAIAGIKCLENQKIFAIPNAQLQEDFKSKNINYNQIISQNIESVLITSLGFGGTNGALVLRRSM